MKPVIDPDHKSAKISGGRALSRITCLPVTLFCGHMNVNTHTYIQASQDVFCELKSSINTHFDGVTDDFLLRIFYIYLLLHLLTPPQPVQWYFYLSIMGFACPNDGWSGLCIKVCLSV